MKKSIIFGLVVVLVVAGFFMFSGDDGINGNSIQGVSAQEVTMYKSPSCGCCVGHGAYLGRNGFDVNTIANDVTLDGIKDEYGIPGNMRSCHTEIIDGYFIEGHIPIEAINKLLSERPDIDGIAMPGMPSGSPGMPGVKKGDWIIYSIKDGQTGEFMRI